MGLLAIQTTLMSHIYHGYAIQRYSNLQGEQKPLVQSYIQYEKATFAGSSTYATQQATFACCIDTATCKNFSGDSFAAFYHSSFTNILTLKYVTKVSI